MAAHVTSSLELWRAYRRSKDPALRERLVEADLALVKYLAARIASRLPKHLRLDDLFSAGLLGFLAAVDDYDPERGVGFSSYASHRIRGAIFDELRRLDWVPRGTRERMRDAQRAIDTLSGRLDRSPTDQEVAKELGIEPEAYRASLGEGITLVSLSATGAPGNGEPTLMDSVEDVSAPDPVSHARRGRATGPSRPAHRRPARAGAAGARPLLLRGADDAGNRHGDGSDGIARVAAPRERRATAARDAAPPADRSR